jgi:hypothetical protein
VGRGASLRHLSAASAEGVAGGGARGGAAAGSGGGEDDAADHSLRAWPAAAGRLHLKGRRAAGHQLISDRIISQCQIFLLIKYYNKILTININIISIKTTGNNNNINYEDINHSYHKNVSQLDSIPNLHKISRKLKTKQCSRNF